jgi:hypothetical protein
LTSDSHYRLQVPAGRYMIINQVANPFWGFQLLGDMEVTEGQVVTRDLNLPCGLNKVEANGRAMKKSKTERGGYDVTCPESPVRAYPGN